MTHQPTFLEVVSRLSTLHGSVNSRDGAGELSREGSGLKCVETFMELLDLGNPKDDPITISSIQDAMEGRPPQCSCMSADAILLSRITNYCHGGLDRGLAVKLAVQRSDGILIICQDDVGIAALGTYIVAPPGRGISIAREKATCCRTGTKGRSRFVIVPTSTYL